MPRFDDMPPSTQDSGHGSREASPAQQPPKLCWTENVSKESLDDFLDANKPSKTKSSLDGWVWVRSARNPHSDMSEEEREDFDEAVAQAAELEAEVRAKVEKIRNDPTVPARTSKKGPGRKDLIKKEGERLLRGLAELGKARPALETGKWMWFEPPDKVDTLFAVLARSLIDGPLARLGHGESDGPVVHTLKAATREGYAGAAPDKGRQHLVCLCFDNIWDKEHATRVLHSILADHGLRSPSAAKCDLYTYINLTSTHPTEVRSSNWRPVELIFTDVQDELREAFWTSKKSGEWDKQEKIEREQFRKQVGGSGAAGVNSKGASSRSSAAKASTLDKDKRKVDSSSDDKGEGSSKIGAEKHLPSSSSPAASTSTDKAKKSTHFTDSATTSSGSSSSSTRPAVIPPKPLKVVPNPSIQFGGSSNDTSDSSDDDEAERARERARRGGLERLAAKDRARGRKPEKSRIKVVSAAEAVFRPSSRPAESEDKVDTARSRGNTSASGSSASASGSSASAAKRGRSSADDEETDSQKTVSEYDFGAESEAPAAKRVKV
ncbi:hypothetical protein V8E36_008765 [Tilletia maclaganii]